jgi:hypothetical protein
MKEILPEILSLNVEKLRNHKGKIEAKLERVIPVDVIGQVVLRVAFPYFNRIPEPWFLFLKCNQIIIFIESTSYLIECYKRP